MNDSTVLIIGATGLIGKELVKQLLEMPEYNKVVVLVRNWDDISHPKLQVVKVDFNDKQLLERSVPPGQTIFSAIGTTQKKVKGDTKEYRKIDFDIPIDIASVAIARGYKKFMLVSSVGANKKSSNFYLRLKGEVEEALSVLPFKQISIFRPSVLIGERKDKRFGEAAGAIVTKLLSFILLGSLSKYKAIHASSVARAMINVSLQNQSNTVSIYHHDEIKFHQ